MEKRPDGRYVLHQSDLGTFEYCGYGFYLEQIKGKKAKVSWYACRGWGTHKAREVALRDKFNGGKGLEPDDLIDIARMEINQKVNDDEVDLTDDDLSGKGKQAAAGWILNKTTKLVRLDRSIFIPKIQPALIEQAMTIHLPDFPFDLSGRIDCLTVDGVMPDLKTSKKKWSQDKADESYQPPVYGLMAKTLTGNPIKRFEFHILVDSKSTGGAYTIPTPLSDARLVSVLERFRALQQSIEKGVFTPCSPSSWKCSAKWCNFHGDCKYVRK